MTLTTEKTPRNSQSEIQRDSANRLSNNDWSQAQKITDGFLSEPMFLEAVASTGENPTDKSSFAYINTLSVYAEDYVYTHLGDETLDSDQANQILLLANVPLAMDTQRQLKNFEEARTHRRLNNDEWAHLKSLLPFSIWFNQLIGDYAQQHPDGKKSDLDRALITSALSSFPRETQFIDHAIKATTRGARNEATTRQLLDIGGADYTVGSIEDDTRGGDALITIRGHKIKFDFKSSLDKIAGIRGGYDKMSEKGIYYAIHKLPGERKEDNVVLLLSGVTDNDLGDRLGIDPDSDFAKKRAAGLMHQIDLAAKELRI